MVCLLTSQRSINPHERCDGSVCAICAPVVCSLITTLCTPFLVDRSLGSCEPVLIPAGRVPKTHATVAYMRALQEREPDWEERINQVLVTSRLEKQGPNHDACVGRAAR